MNTHVSTHYLIQMPASPSQSTTGRVGEQLTGLLKSQSGLMLLGCLVVIAVLQLWSAKYSFALIRSELTGEKF